MSLLNLKMSVTKYNGKVLVIVSFKRLLCPVLSLPYSEIPATCILEFLLLSHRTVKLLFLFFSLFSVFFRLNNCSVFIVTEYPLLL